MPLMSRKSKEKKRRSEKAGHGHRRPSCIFTLFILSILVVTFWLSRESLLSAMGEHLVISSEPEASEALIVLSGGTPERAAAAVDLYHQGFAPKIYLTRNRRSPALEKVLERGWKIPENADIEKMILIQAGVPEEKVIILPGTVDSTIDEARKVARLVSEEAMKGITVVTSNYHTRRTALTFEHFLVPLGVRVLIYASPYSEFEPLSWWKKRHMVRILIIEYQKLIYYRLAILIGRL
jgi:uncharacterized SAM-binding protein YcdF (DUF218 family)